MKKKKTDMDKLTKGYESFIKDKGVNKDGKEKFEKALKRSIKKQSN
jgi:hypothetical protein